MGQDLQIFEEALVRVAEGLCHLDGVGDTSVMALRLPNLLSPEDCLDWSVERLGVLACDAARHLEDCNAATAMIEARGDRIDRLNVDNRAALDALVSGLSTGGP
jgi:hypothetical protein